VPIAPRGNSAVSQYWFDPATYLDMMRAEVPAYERLQRAVAEATAELTVARVLDLGTGTGETLGAVLEVHPGAVAVGVDKNDAMLGEAGRRLAGSTVGLLVADLTDPLPAGPFDLVVSALAIHHLEGPDKADLFGRIGGVLRPVGRFVLGDVVIPVDQPDAVTPLTSDHDRPSTLADQLHWLEEAGFEAGTVWSEHDLVVVRADRRR
jgi:tRNA (cmo5U34)-methyltransferase